MKFDYVIHITRQGDRTYTLQIQDKSSEKPFTTSPVANLEWAKMWAAIPRAIESRENSKIAEMKVDSAPKAAPKDWVPTAAGQPAPPVTPAPTPTATVPTQPQPTPEISPRPAKPNRYIKTPASGPKTSTNPNPTI